MHNAMRATIYSHVAHFSHELDKQTRTLQVPKSAIVDSVIVIDAEGTIVPFSYVSADNIFKITNRTTGEKFTGKVQKGDTIITGKIINYDSDRISLLEDNNVITVNNPDIVTVNTKDSTNGPLLIFDSDRIGGQYFMVSYLASGISWKPIGTALIGKDGKIYLRIAGSITNDTEMDLTADLTLVSGSAKQPKHEERALMATPSNGVTSGMVEDYVSYTLGRRLIREKDSVELGLKIYDVTKIYSHTTNSDKVEFGYQWMTDGYIPACNVNAYLMSDTGGIGDYLGTDDINESQQEDIIRLILGESTNLQCHSLVNIVGDIILDEKSAIKYIDIETYRRNQDNSWHLITESIKVDITNHNPYQVTLLLRHYVGNKLLVGTECEPNEIRKGGYLEWLFTVREGTPRGPYKTTTTCKVTTISYM